MLICLRKNQSSDIIVSEAKPSISESRAPAILVESPFVEGPVTSLDQARESLTKQSKKN